MKIARSIIDGIDGVGWYSIIGLVLFFLFFTLMFIYVMKIKKTTADELAHIPLDKDAFTTDNNNLEPQKQAQS